MAKTSTAPREREFIGFDPDDGSPIYGRRLLGEELARACRRLFGKAARTKSSGSASAVEADATAGDENEGAATASSEDESAADSGDDGPPSPGARPRFAPALSGAVLGAGGFA